TLSDTVLDELDDALKLAEAPELLRRTVEGERVWEMNQLAAMLGPDWPDRELQPVSVKRQPVWERRRLLRATSDYLAATAPMMRAAGEPWPQVLEAMPVTFPHPRLFVVDFPVPWSSPMEIAGQTLAATRAARVAIAIERYRRRHRTLPSSLTEMPS